MEFVLVNYPEKRKVFIDGEDAGSTNAILWVDEGTRLFALGEPVDYKPESVERQVAGTTALNPMEVTFEKLS